MSIFIRDRKFGKSWSEIFFDFLDLAKERFDVEMKKRRRNAIKVLISVFISIIGTIYFINGISALIGKIFGNDWTGQLIIGLLLIVIGFFLSKK